MDLDFNICEEETWHGFHLLYGRRSPLQRAQRSFETLDYEKRDRLLTMERDLREIHELEMARRDCGKEQLPNGTLPDFAKEYNLSLAGAKKLYNKFKRIGTIRDTRGHPEECWLTLQQQKELIGLYLIKTYYLYLADGTSQKSSTYRATVTATFVTSAVRQSFPNLQTQTWFTPEYVKRYLHKREKDNPAPFLVARRGDKDLYNLFLPNLPNNDATFPFERGQTDGRYLPIYIAHKGMVCTVVLLLFLDDNSGYIPSFLLRPRKEIDGIDGMEKPHKVDFKAADVRLLFAEVMRSTGLRFKIIYTDNGSQFVALHKVLHYLVTDEDIPILLVHTEPGRPQGRGKVEDALKRVGAELSHHGGYVEDEKDLMSWRRAREHGDLMDLVKLRGQVKKAVDKLNNTPHIGETLTPYEKWQRTPGPRYNAPPPDRFIHLVDGEESLQTVSKKGVQYNKGTKHSKPVFFVPRDASAETDMRWFNAVGRNEQVRFQIHKMEEFGTFYYALLDGEHWEEVVLATKHSRSLDQRMENRHKTLSIARHEVNLIRAEITASQIERHGMLPQHDPITEEAVYKKPKRKSKSAPKTSDPDHVLGIEEDEEHSAVQPDDVAVETPLAPVRSESALLGEGVSEIEPTAPRAIDPAEAQALEDMFEHLKRKYASQ